MIEDTKIDGYISPNGLWVAVPWGKNIFPFIMENKYVSITHLKLLKSLFKKKLVEKND